MQCFSLVIQSCLKLTAKDRALNGKMKSFSKLGVKRESYKVSFVKKPRDYSFAITSIPTLVQIPISYLWSKTVWRIVTVYLLFLISGFAVAPAQSAISHPCEDVDSYYGGVGLLKGKALKTRLYSIISPHRPLSYKQVWDALSILDAANAYCPEISEDVIEIYSLKVVSKRLAGKPEGWNREHLWPRSYGVANWPLLTDIHNIRPADVNVNSSRGNKYYGECHVTSVKCLKPAHKEATLDTETDGQIWAPPVQDFSTHQWNVWQCFKKSFFGLGYLISMEITREANQIKPYVRGDIARAIMYMAICYGFHQPGGRNLYLSDSPNIENREMGLLSSLLRWNEIDTPSWEEKLRNERICKFYQHNRNPFVDHPEYANLIWTTASNHGNLGSH
ncbi:hypothetical protein K2173_011528 [Erythroxylum novogranatense]|uniref:Uncharacterized protein n=1 Tax=Erythroxylum novogranatense TaxID=1862640 RepID=A0AAV8TWU8_9ROSI|nr:hypothetical protein K2173_011528 [Erythroxylum novogranatense]